jgi:hypothetical protein
MDVNKLNIDIKRLHSIKNNLKDKIVSLDQENAALENRLHCQDVSFRDVKRKLERQIDQVGELSMSIFY